MRNKYWYGLVPLLAVLLSACAQPTAAPTQTAVPATPTTVVEEVAVESAPAECRPYDLLDVILPAPNPNLAPITADDHVLGPENARVTILEFSDFQ